MATLWVMAAMGLLLLGVPAAWVLALVTAALGTVPTASPNLAGEPTVLIGFTISSQNALGAIALCLLVQ